MSLPGIDTVGKEVYESSEAGEVSFPSRAPGRSTHHHRLLAQDRLPIEESATKFILASAPNSTAVAGLVPPAPLLLTHLDSCVADQVLEESKTLLAAAVAQIEAFDTALCTDASPEVAPTAAGTFVSAEQRVAVLERIVGTVPTRADRAPSGSVVEMLVQMERRFKDFALMDETMVRLTTDLIKAMGVGLASFDKMKEDFRATNASATNARAAILFNVVLSAESVAEELPSIVERLRRLKQLLADAAAKEELTKGLRSAAEQEQEVYATTLQ